MSVPFDPGLDSAVLECLRLASTEQLGREAARRVENYCIAAKGARDRAEATDDIVQVAGAAAEADYAAAQASSYVDVVVALIGNGDATLLQHTVRQGQTARTHAAMAARHWTRLKQRRGAAHA